ncbi:MAG: manganese efflux pump [Eubacterium sp.]|nr:manganese efflux pump [Eubacterium sp.]
MNLMFFVNSILFGFGLAMDAFSVSVANGLSEPKMRRRKAVTIAGTFAFFQCVMPLIGWAAVHFVVSYFKKVEPFIPYVALILLLYIGGKMVYESILSKGEEEKAALGAGTLFVQGIATSIDALSVGFTTQSYGLTDAFISALIIGVVTFGVCVAGIKIGKVFGDRFSSRATLLGGIVLIGIGIEIFIKGVFF